MYPDSMNIRLATPADWPTLKKLNQVIDYSQPEAFMHESVKRQRVLVAETKNEVVGYALWQVLWGNTPVLSLLKIFPKHQRNGAGSALLAAVEKKFIKHL